MSLISVDYIRWTPMAQLIERFQAEFAEAFAGVQLTGGSGYGWSYWGSLERCPRLFFNKYVKKVEAPEDERIHRDVGSVVHAYLALARSQPPVPAPMALHQYLLEHKGNPEAVWEGWRLFEAYLSRYREDYLVPLAVEFTMMDKKSRRSCRYDLVAEVLDTQAARDMSIRPGAWIVEYKTMSQFSETNLTSWDVDGEILGQIMLWKKLKLDKKFGPLQGVIVDIIGKQKVPDFYRAVVDADTVAWKRHERVLSFLDKQRKRFQSLKWWPTYTMGCVGRYGACDYIDICRTERT